MPMDKSEVARFLSAHPMRRPTHSNAPDNGKRNLQPRRVCSVNCGIYRGLLFSSFLLLDEPTFFL